jgi:DNA-binding GntR family transcriptional regulator
VAHTALITQNADTANAVECTNLALNAPHARVLRLTRIQYDASGCPLAREDVVLPLDRFPGLTADVSDITELAQCYSLSLGGVTERVSIVPAARGVAMHLEITAGTNVLKLDRLVETVDGKPVEWRVAYRKI